MLNANRYSSITRGLFFCLLLNFISPSLSALEYSRADTRETCQWIFDKVWNTASGSAQKGYHWAKDKIIDPKAISPKEYEELRTRKVADYFPNQELTPENIDRFFEDYSKVVHNFGKMQLAGGMFFPKHLPKEKELRDHWEKVRDDVMKYGFVAVEKDKTLEQLLLDQHFEHSRPKDVPPLSDRAWQFAKEAPWLPIVGTKKAALFILGESKWAFRSAVLGSTLAVMLGLFTNPLNDNIAIFMNEHFGHIGVQMQLWFADLDKARSKLNELVTVKEEMAEVSRKYQMHELTEKEAMDLWRKLEETFLRYAQEFNSVVPSNVASGRSYFRDGNIMNPLTFVTAASSVQSEILGFESAIREYELLEKSNGKLTEEQTTALQAAKTRLKTSKERMGAVLAAIRIHEMIYPEYTRSKFQAEKSTNELFQSYKVLMGSMHLDDYSDVYLKEMDSVLHQIGIQLDHMESSKSGKTKAAK